MNTFCTIITSDYAPYAIALYKSLVEYDPTISLQVLITNDVSNSEVLNRYPGIKQHFPKGFFNYGLTHALYKKYAHINMDEFRWALKPVFISYLLEHGFDKVLYTDCDIYFYKDYAFLFDELDTASITLTPHWRNSSPLVDEESFFSLFTGGIFNAGFIGANRKGLPALKWWAEACHFKMGPFLELGIHDDQRYLDAFPVKFEDVKIIRHRGCNIAAWNQIECKRELLNGTVMINGEYPVVFVHWSHMLIKEILKGHDKHLLPYFQQYKDTFEESGSRLSDFMNDIDLYTKPRTLMQLKWKLLLRTRIKRFLYKLAENL